MNPGLEVQTDNEITEFIRGNAETIYHPVGTCKMGNDEFSVADDKLRVRANKFFHIFICLNLWPWI